MKLQIFLASWFILVAFSGWADIDIDQQNVGSEKINEPAKRTPFSFNSHVDVMGSSKINKGFYKGDKIKYAEALAEAGTIVYYCPAYTEGARVAIGYSPTYIRWERNPWFEQDHFNTVFLTLTGFSKRLDRWFLRSQLTANFDADEWSGKYTSYDIVFWSRYTYSERVGLHFGFWAETGLHLDRVYPIIGFDWQISRRWKLNLVFPVNVSLVYEFSRHWSLALAGRNFDSRFRVHHDEHSHKPLLRYQNIGAEFLVKYENETMSANLHAGSTLGGKLRLADRRDRHAHHYRFDPAGYVGAEVEVKF